MIHILETILLVAIYVLVIVCICGIMYIGSAVVAGFVARYKDREFNKKMKELRRDYEN